MRTKKYFEETKIKYYYIYKNLKNIFNPKNNFTLKHTFIYFILKNKTRDGTSFQNIYRYELNSI